MVKTKRRLPADYPLKCEEKDTRVGKIWNTQWGSLLLADFGNRINLSAKKRGKTVAWFTLKDRGDGVWRSYMGTQTKVRDCTSGLHEAINRVLSAVTSRTQRMGSFEETGVPSPYRIVGFMNSLALKYLPCDPGFLGLRGLLFPCLVGTEATPPPKYLSRFFRTTRLTEAIRRLLGSSGSALMRVVAWSFQSHAYAWDTLTFVYLAHKKHWPLDYLIEILQTKKLGMVEGKRPYSLLLELPARKAMTLLRGSERLYDARDASRMILEIRLRDPKYAIPESKTLREIHDLVTRDWQRIKHENFPIPLEGLRAKLHGLEILDHKILAPTSSHQMLDWGNQLSNCIGSYADWVLAGQTQVFALEHRGRITHGIEVRGRDVIQFSEKYNRRVPDDDPLFGAFCDLLSGRNQA